MVTRISLVGTAARMPSTSWTAPARVLQSRCTMLMPCVIMWPQDHDSQHNVTRELQFLQELVRSVHGTYAATVRARLRQRTRMLATIHALVVH